MSFIVPYVMWPDAVMSAAAVISTAWLRSSLLTDGWTDGHAESINMLYVSYSLM